MTVWQASLYDTSEEQPFLKYSSTSTSPPKSLLRTVEVKHVRLPQKGDLEGLGDHLIDIRWTDSNGSHHKQTRIDDLQVQKRFQRHRAAGAFTEWGRVEVHMEAGGHPRVFIYSGVTDKPYEVMPQTQSATGNWIYPGGFKDDMYGPLLDKVGAVNYTVNYSSTNMYGGGGGGSGLSMGASTWLPPSAYASAVAAPLDPVTQKKEKIKAAKKAKDELAQTLKEKLTKANKEDDDPW